VSRSLLGCRCGRQVPDLDGRIAGREFDPMPTASSAKDQGVVWKLSWGCLCYHENELVFYLIFYLKSSFLSDFRA
jgi:hypothetical protein